MLKNPAWGFNQGVSVCNPLGNFSSLLVYRGTFSLSISPLLFFPPRLGQRGNRIVGKRFATSSRGGFFFLRLVWPGPVGLFYYPTLLALK